MTQGSDRAGRRPNCTAELFQRLAGAGRHGTVDAAGIVLSSSVGCGFCLRSRRACHMPTKNTVLWTLVIGCGWQRSG